MIPMVMLARQIPETLVEERSILMGLTEAIGNCASGQSRKKRALGNCAYIQSELADNRDFSGTYCRI
jgi:hypothetical protein